MIYSVSNIIYIYIYIFICIYVITKIPNGNHNGNHKNFHCHSVFIFILGRHIKHTFSNTFRHLVFIDLLFTRCQNVFENIHTSQDHPITLTTTATPSGTLTHYLGV